MMLLTLLGNFGKYSLLQHGHIVFFPTYYFTCTFISKVIKSRATSSFSIVLHPQEHVPIFDICIVSSALVVTVGADLLCPFSLPGFLPDFTRLF